VKGGTIGEKWPRKFSLTIDSHIIVGFFNLPQSCDMGQDGFTSPLKEGMLRIFTPENSDGFGRVSTRELGYQRPAC
jgi:hypothetical protein